jgi:hypothetical protein
MTAARQYVYGTPQQYAALAGHAIDTLEDLLKCVTDCYPRALVPSTRGAPVLKKYLLLFLTKRCNGLFLDFERAFQDKVLQMGGVFPKQWIGVCSRKSHDVVATARVEGRRAPRVDLCREFNGGIEDDEEALLRALSASQCTMPTSCIDDDDDELCCPITCERFRDPVQTLHGQTYERRAIAEWLASHDTDPLTGVRLLTTQVWPDVEMLARCTT